MNQLTKEEQINQEIDQINQLASQGLVVEVDPDTAEEMGAFLETALTAEEAEASIFDNELIEEE